MDAQDTGQGTHLGIKEASQRTGLPASTIRYYDQQFEEYLGLTRGPGRKRLFSPDSVDRLLKIHDLLKKEGLSVRQARKALAGDGPGLAAGGPDRLEVERLKAEVAELRKQVLELKEIQLRTLALVDRFTAS